MAEYDKEISVVGKSCPLPLIQLAKVTNSLESGQRVRITGDDPIFEIGVRDFCELHGFSIINLERSDDSRQITILIQC
ncbi:MAG: sulfurtransferase TusA family protein [Gammaproteobacteria bacterium]